MPSPWQVGQSFDTRPGAVAARAGNVELHPAAHLRHLAGAVALRAMHRAAGVRLAVAGGARLLPVDLDARLAAANRRPEIHRRLVLKIGARLRSARTLLLLLRSRKDAGEDVFEAAPSRRARAGLLPPDARRPGNRKSRSRRNPPAAAAARALLARIGLGLRRVDLVGVEAELVVNLALLLVAQNVVGLGDLLELLLGLLVAGIHVGMIFARSFPEGLADLLRRGRLLHAERCVIVFLSRCGHLDFLCLP